MAAKKAPAKTVEVAPQQEVVAKVATPQKQEPVKPTWEIKDRMYIVVGQAPLTLTISSKHTSRHPLLWFDKEKGIQREIRYATNQNSPLIDEQKGEATLGHIMFKDGALYVKKEKQNLQKLLSLYHPLLGNKYYEHNPVAIAEDELEDLEIEVDAMIAARTMEVDQAEAILRVEIGSKVSSMTSKELKRDLMLFAKRNPHLFMELANDDNVHLRNIAIKASEMGIIKLSQDQRTFTWGSNGRKLMTVPFDENPYSAMAAYFKTDEGVEVFRSVEKNLE
ncbi:hypothetical protein N9Q93_00655 [bacterium]|nr:hypothetical protein [bacterium]MDA9330200.1 hypothetical protein [bacterium]MDB4298036.1 hypothetical protein [bacterium]|tara:strand:+ start:127 stop:960 length:834 start_codon:yes stop_codon:yes gene_type:complete